MSSTLKSQLRLVKRCLLENDYKNALLLGQNALRSFIYSDNILGIKGTTSVDFLRKLEKHINEGEITVNRFFLENAWFVDVYTLQGRCIWRDYDFRDYESLIEEYLLGIELLINGRMHSFPVSLNCSRSLIDIDPDISQPNTYLPRAIQDHLSFNELLDGLSSVVVIPGIGLSETIYGFFLSEDEIDYFDQILFELGQLEQKDDFEQITDFESCENKIKVATSILSFGELLSKFEQSINDFPHKFIPQEVGTKDKPVQREAVAHAALNTFLHGHSRDHFTVINELPRKSERYDIYLHDKEMGQACLFECKVLIGVDDGVGYVQQLADYMEHLQNATTALPKIPDMGFLAIFDCTKNQKRPEEESVVDITGYSYEISKTNHDLYLVNGHPHNILLKYIEIGEVPQC